MFASLSPSAAPTAVGAGYVSTWGLNTHSVLGDGSTADRSRVPVSVSAIAGNTVTQMASGSYFNCAVAGGAVYCWGDNTSGQLGNNSLVDSPLPVPVDTSGVLAGKTITAVAAGGQLACALADGAAYCWGHNMYGGLGNKTTVDSSVPVAVDMTGVLAGKRITSIAVSHQFACAVADGAGYCWGSNWVGELGNGASAVVANPSPTAVVMTGALAGKTINAIDLGSSHACALASGAVYCWGTGMHGALGTGDFTAAKVPVAVRTNGVLAGKTVTAISAGYDTGCAVADGAAYCWGYNNYGQLGIGYTGDTPNPSVVIASNALAGKTVTAINSGSWHTCAIADGAAYCWGQGQGGQLGDGDLAGADKTEPVAVKTDGVLSGKTITAIDTGYYHTAALYK
jgi:alpha-tubulin suppressor-like RCC1 family protein